MSSMQEVARLAGVSPATVSRVMNGQPTVQEVYRKRVLSAITELDYRPNRLARNLRKQQVDMIGVVVSDIENPHFSEMVRAVEDEAYRRGYRVLLCNTDETPTKERDYLNVLAGERVLGVIISPASTDDPAIGQLLDLGIPIVAFDRRLGDPRADAVVANNEAAAALATRHLIDLGHRRVAFVGGREDVETGAQRRAGYERLMREAGQEPQVVNGGFRLQGGFDATTALLQVDAPPTALVVANNLMTMGALRALRAASQRVPQDVALVAIDDPFWAEHVEPALTTLAQPVRLMAHHAMALLLQRIEGTRQRPKQVVYECELRIRRSSGPPRRDTGEMAAWPQG